MGIFSGNNGNGELALVFDIGSSSVGGALFYRESSGVPKIIFSFREKIVLEESIDAERFLTLTMKSLEIVAGKIYAARLGAPKRIFCVLSSPWYFSQTRIIKLQKNIPFIFNTKLAEILVQKEIASFEEEHSEKNKDNKEQVRSIEFKNIKTMLNGYETLVPLNQKAKDLEITIFISASPEQVLKNIEETIGKHFHPKNIRFSPFALASFAVVRDMYEKQENFLLIDIGGEVTDISMIKKNVLSGSVSFPLGFNSLVRGVASGLNCSLDEAYSHISLFKDGHAAESTLKNLSPVITKLMKEWLGEMQESLTSLASGISIPSTIYMVVDKDLSDFFSQTIEAEQFSQYSLTESKFKVVFLGTEVFHGMAAFEENIIRDPVLIIDSVYINRFSNKI